MESSVIVQIAVIGAMGLIGLGVVSMFVSGIKSLMQGKQDLKRIVIMAVPFIIFGVAFGVLGDIPKAGVLTTMAMMGVMVVSVVITGLRGTFKF